MVFGISSVQTVKKINEEIEAFSSHSSNPECNGWDPTGKTPDEIAAWYADYERGQSSKMAKRRRRGVEAKHPVFYLRAWCND